MAWSNSGHCPHGGERRLQIVEGKICNQPCFARPYSPKIPATMRGGANRGSSWGFVDSGTRRKKRVAMYMVYTMGGKVKASLRKGLRWIKIKCSPIIHGY